MKKLFKLSIFDTQSREEKVKEVIADTQYDAVINEIHANKNSVIEVTPIPYETMTTAQKIKVIDADWESHERKLRTQAIKNSVKESIDRIDELCRELRKEILQ